MMRSRPALRALVASRIGVLSMASLGVLVLAVVLGPMFFEGSATRLDFEATFLGSSLRHPFGTDSLGRDILARTIVATRPSILLALAATILGAIGGLLLGAIPPSLPNGFLRSASSRVISTSLAFPPIVIALLVATIVGIGRVGVVIGVAAGMVPNFARLSESLLVTSGHREYVDSARLLGQSRWAVTRRHVLPNVAPTLILTLAVSMASMVIVISSLSFVGLGTQLPGYDWGNLLGQGMSSVYIQPWAAIGPGLMIIATGVVLGMCGEAVARALNPHLWTGTGSSSRPLTTSRDPAIIEQSSSRTQVEPDSSVLRISDLTVEFPGGLRAVDGVSLDLRSNEILGLVGESGSGKTLTALSMVDLLPDSAEMSATRLDVLGRDLLDLSTAERNRYLATTVGVVAQDPGTAFNPARRVGPQIVEGVRFHNRVSRRSGRQLATELLRTTRVPDPDLRAQQFPHQLSGGLRQRSAIAMALANDPAILIADEPTTALDATIRGQILQLLEGFRRERGASVLLISHDLATIARVCDRVVVMYAGRVVEELPTGSLAAAVHPYTQALAASTLDLAVDTKQPLRGLPGQPPTLDRQLDGCAFAPRCAAAIDRCATETPSTQVVSEGHHVACWVRVPVPARYEQGADR